MTSAFPRPLAPLGLAAAFPAVNAEVTLPQDLAGPAGTRPAPVEPEPGLGASV
jgi:hypothetical protein